jgi:nicotinamidase-related amidase
MAVIEQIYGRTAVIFGVATEDSVLEAVRGFRRHGLPCRVVRDAIRGRDAEKTTRAERSIIETGALFVTADEIIREIDHGSESWAS